MIINASGLGFAALNKALRECADDCDTVIENCLGQRFIASGMNLVGRNLKIEGIPGNALGAYLCGGSITVSGNAQDAVGDTMNDGTITVCGSIGDAVGYAMRGGEIYIKGNAGYRAGIHMKEYEGKKPVIVIGGRAGSFLGEYQAGGLIIVLGMNTDGRPAVGNFPCTGMHGGKMIIRGSTENIRFPDGVTLREATEEDLCEIRPYIERFCGTFGYCADEMMKSRFSVIMPDSKNPYKKMYVPN